LLVGPSQESLAEELTQSTLRPGQTSNTGAALTVQPNDINVQAIKNLRPIVMDWMTDDGRFFVLTDKQYQKLKWYDRKKIYNRTRLDDEAEAVKMIAGARWSVGFDDWRGVTGYNPN
jgi:hypothetical protein